MKIKRRSTSSIKDKEKGNNVRRKNITRKNDGRTGTIFLTAILQSHSQLWAIFHGAASLTRC